LNSALSTSAARVLHSTCQKEVDHSLEVRVD
jgi:hypothetical protein